MLVMPDYCREPILHVIHADSNFTFDRPAEEKNLAIHSLATLIQKTFIVFAQKNCVFYSISWKC